MRLRQRIFLGLLCLVALTGAGEPRVVDLNTATLHELMQLPGLGPKRAEEIIRRRLLAPFRRTSDLMRIKGIGRKTFLKLRPFVRVAPPAEATPAVETGPAQAAATP